MCRALAAEAESNEQARQAVLERDRAAHAAESERQAKNNETAQRRRAEAAQRHAMDALRGMTDDVIDRLIGEKPSLGPTEKSFLEATLRRWELFAQDQGDGEQNKVIRAEGGAARC